MGRLTLYLWRKVDIGTSIEEQLSHIQVFIMCSDVQWRESSLGDFGGGRAVAYLTSSYIACVKVYYTSDDMTYSFIQLNCYKCLVLKQL